MEHEDKLHQVIEKVIDALALRGESSIASMGRLFRQMDSYDGGTTVSRDHFREKLLDNRVNLDDDEMKLLADEFGSDKVDFNKFLIAVRGEMNETRQVAVDTAFYKFDQTNSGKVEVKDLKNVYLVEDHPKYNSGEWSKDEVLQEFKRSFGIEGDQGSITKQEWDEYYAAVSFNYDDDDLFLLALNDKWRL